MRGNQPLWWSGTTTPFRVPLAILLPPSTLRDARVPPFSAAYNGTLIHFRNTFVFSKAHERVTILFGTFFGEKFLSRGASFN